MGEVLHADAEWHDNIYGDEVKSETDWKMWRNETEKLLIGRTGV